MSVAARIRIVALVVVSLIAAGFGAGTSVHNTTAVDGILGDVNCGGTVDTVDALQILRLTAGLSTNAACMDPAGDVDCDGDNDTVDSLRILRHVAGLSNTTPDGCTPIGDPLGPPPSSFDLIEEAVAGGSIDDETGLIYKVYAVFGDGRLPDQYKGDDSDGPVDSFILTDVQSRFDTLSPAAQTTLRPFLIPPAYKGSWASPLGSQVSAVTSAGDPEPICKEIDPNWKWQDASTAKVRVWWQTKYPQDEQWAKDIAKAMDEKIWPSLTGLMGKPLSDEELECNGGDGRLDIYLALEGNMSFSPNYWPPGCEKTPAFIYLSRAHGLQEIVHEFMHTILWGYDVKEGCVYDSPTGEYNWLTEATAVWAEDYVYPHKNGEHDFAPWFLSEPDKPLYTYDGKHEYGAYLFFLFITKYDPPALVRGVWDKAAEYNSLEALENTLADGFWGRWPRFALCNWNRPPVDCYKQWDGLDQGVADLVKPTVVSPVSLGGEENRSFQLAAGVKPLAASYTDFVFDDDNVHSVVFHNTLADFPHAGVQGLVKIDGQWQGADYWNWTHEPSKGFCRDIEGQHIEELVIIISNDDWENKGGLLPLEQPRLEARKAGCTVPDWVGTASVEIVQDGVTYAATASNLRFEQTEPDNTGGRVEYALTESSAVNWTVSGTQTSTGCAVSGDMAVQPANGTMGDGRAWGYIWVDFEAGEYEGNITAYNSEAVQTWACPDEPPPGSHDTSFGGDGLIMVVSGEGFSGFPMTEDGFLVGEYSAFGHHYQWHLEPAPPLGQ